MATPEKRPDSPATPSYIPRFIGRIGIADIVSLGNLSMGVFAVISTFTTPALAARFILVGVILDGIDGLLARSTGGTPVGTFIDSLADVVTFCVAPAMLVVGTGLPLQEGGRPLWTTFVYASVIAYVTMGAVRLSLYSTFDSGTRWTEGATTTLAATILMASYLTGLRSPRILVAGLLVFAYLMSVRVRYPDLKHRHALFIGLFVFGAVLPGMYGRLSAGFVTLAALLYLIGGPSFYRSQ